VPLLLEEAGEADPLPMASVWKDGQRIGTVTSAGWSYTLGKAVALAYVRRDLVLPGVRLEVTVLGMPQPAVVGAAPLTDVAATWLEA
jgi:dimethylglycine dehydrogenase